MKWLLLVHIGPVQDFIMSARRCRDLWFGSELLSALAAAAADAIQTAMGEDGGQLIFPNAASLKSEQGGVANKIVVQVYNADGDRCKSIAEAGRDALKNRLEAIATDVFDGIESRAASGDFQRERARQQIQECMEYMWVAVRENGDYASARTRGEALLAARKNTRNWNQSPPVKAGIPKSSLDGARESVIHERVYGKRGKNGAKIDPMPINQRYNIYGIKGEERLCGVGIVKRLGRIDLHDSKTSIPKFHSAGHIASAGLRRRLTAKIGNEDVAEAYDKWMAALESKIGEGGIAKLRLGAPVGEALAWTSNGQEVPFLLPERADQTAKSHGLDGILLYPQRIRELAALYQDSNEEFTLSDFQNIERSLRSFLKEIGVTTPYPYYALLVADGDKMGKAINTLQTSEGHKAFSEALDKEFAQKTRKIIKDHGGTLIFAGGDDVLAMLPLFTALEAARALRDQFQDAMAKAAVEVEDEDGQTSPPTLSVGLGIGHLMTPFAEVRALGKQAEQLAKNSGRNRLAICWDKRSGKTRQVVGEWRDDEHCIDRRLRAMATWLEKAGVPRSFAHKLLEVTTIAGPLPQAPTNNANGPKDAQSDDDWLISLAKRVVRRRNLNDEELTNQFFSFLDRNDDNDSRTAAQRIADLANELLLANEFHSALKEADMDMTPSSSNASSEAAE